MIMGIISLIVLIVGIILTIYEFTREINELYVSILFLGFILMGIGIAGTMYFIHVNIDIIRIWFTI